MTTTGYQPQLQDRDVELLRGLFESRLITLSQAAAIYFGGSAEAAKKRLQKLKSAGFLAERPRRAYEPSILFLTRKSFEFLAESGQLDAYPPLIWSNLEKRARVSDLTLKHELAVMDVKAAFHTAVRGAPALKIAEFTTWPLLCEFTARPHAGAREMTVRPDGFIRLHETEADGGVSEHAFYLEVDRSTEVLDTLVTRAQCYRWFFQSGGLAIRNGRPREEYALFPFRVLVVVRSPERRNNLAQRLLALHPPILTQVWMGVIKDVLTEPLGRVWMRPGDLRKRPSNQSPRSLIVETLSDLDAQILGDSDNGHTPSKNGMSSIDPIVATSNVAN